MSPFQESHQPTHAGQPADAPNSAPDEDPLAASIDGEGPPFNSTISDAWMDPPGFWDPQFALQSAFDFTMNDQEMIPPFDAGATLLDWTPNKWTDETFGFDTGFASQSALGPTLNEMMPPVDAFGSNPWMDQPIGLSHAEVASQSALFSPGQAPIASDGTRSSAQDASFDGLDQADWINDDAGMPDALGGFADPIR
jgi:hypothetical protein